MKFHWGWGIAIFYSLFVLSFILILVYSFGQDNSLVVEDYYQQDITYQQRMDKRDNYLGLAEKVTHTYDPSAAMVVLSFPSSMSSINGTVQFYRPSSAKQDYLVNLDVDSLKQQVIPVNRLIKGRWKMQVEWEANGESYYMEEQILILK
ncbi:MAG: FixH family protein [Saprospiraceae bacterium]|jgi:nitrogen fixation protein FixH|nr:FixH family protein [Saprospiraceae bacterium]